MNQLKIRRFSESLLKSDPLSALDPDRIYADWYGNALEQPLEFNIGVSPSYLFLLSSFSEQAFARATKHLSGSFQEGLWKEDVVELFVLNEESGQYLELNLSPGGAWWACLFDAYRKFSSEEFPKAMAQVRIEKPSVCLAIERRSLSWLADVEQLKFKIAAIRHESEPIYVASGPARSSKPDFHLIEEFLPVTLV